MTTLLLDTHALLWWWSDEALLPPRVRETLSDADTTVFVSAASAWEIATKVRLGRLTPYRDMVPRFGELALAADLRHLPMTPSPRPARRQLSERAPRPVRPDAGRPGRVGVAHPRHPATLRSRTSRSGCSGSTSPPPEAEAIGRVLRAASHLWSNCECLAAPGPVAVDPEAGVEGERVRDGHAFHERPARAVGQGECLITEVERSAE